MLVSVSVPFIALLKLLTLKVTSPALALPENALPAEFVVPVKVADRFVAGEFSVVSANTRTVATLVVTNTSKIRSACIHIFFISSRLP